MKKLQYLSLSFCLLFTFSAEAQFFKKLKEKVANKVEDVVANNIADKAAKEANDALNKIWETDLKNMNLGLGDPVDPAEIPESYHFGWKYVMNMKTEAGEMNFTYRLKEGAPYMGIEMPKMQNLFIVIDHEKEMSIIFMNDMVRATKLQTEVPEEESTENPYADMEYQKIDSKTILGYDCQGYKAETQEYVFIMYVTDEAGIGFNNFYENQKNIPNNFNPDWINEDSLVMEMQMEDKNDPDKSLTMTCTSIEKEDFTISK